MIDSTEINVITKIVNKFFLVLENKIMINNSAIKIKKLSFLRLIELNNQQVIYIK